MTGFYPDKFKDPPKKSPGEKEVEVGGWLLSIVRILPRFPLPLKDDPRCIARTGELFTRWIRNIFLLGK